MPGTVMQHRVQLLHAALAAWQQQQDEASQAEARRLFNLLPRGQQSILLDIASIAAREDVKFMRCWPRLYGQQAMLWLSELEQHGMVFRPEGAGKTTGRLKADALVKVKLAELTLNTVQDPHSPHYGSRLWLKDGRFVGGVQGAPVLAASFVDHKLYPSTISQLLRDMPAMDYSQAKVLIIREQQPPAQFTEGQMQQLVYLDISHNTMTELPEWFEKLTALQLFVMRSCMLTGLPESFCHLTALQELDLSGSKQLTALPASFGQLASLQHLDLSFCSKLAQLPGSFGQLTALKELHLASCKQLTALPESLGHLTTLEVLDLESCSTLTALPESIGQMTALCKLLLVDCSRLARLPESLGQLVSLQLLDLSRSQLARLPGSIGRLARLQILMLCSCMQLVELPASVGQLSALQCLDASGCGNLQELPESIDGLAQLTKLSLNGCYKLQPFPGWLRSCISEVQERTAQNTWEVPGGGHSDAAAEQDSLGVRPVAKGIAAFLLHPETPVLAMAIYGPWGRGKSSIMQLIKREMLTAAVPPESPTAAKLSKEHHSTTLASHNHWYNRIRCLYRSREASQQADEELRTESPTETSIRELEEAARPWLMTVWFNAWQYLNETEVWAGLVVEVVKQLEQHLSWWECRWLALRFHWRKNMMQLLLRLVLPLLALLGVLAPMMAYGIAKLNEGSSDTAAEPTTMGAAKAAVAISGCIVALLAVVERITATVKQVSDSIMDSANYLTISNTHKAKVGFQNEVKEDLQILMSLLQLQFPQDQRRWSKWLQPWQQQQQRLRIVVFVDDLDRCKPNKVVEVLEAVNLVLGPSGFTVVAGMDKGFISNAVLQSYKGQIDEDKAEEFLQKIVQVSLTLTPPPKRDLCNFLRKLNVNVVHRFFGAAVAAGTGILPAAESAPPFADPAAAGVVLADAAASRKAATTANARQGPEQPQLAAAFMPCASTPVCKADMEVSITRAQPSSVKQQQQQQQQQSNNSMPQAELRRRAVPTQVLLKKGGYKPVEVQAIQQLLDDGLLEGRSPREVKCLINQYRLAKMILLAHDPVKLVEAEMPVLLVWVVLWWRYPRGMQYLLKVIQCSAVQPQDLRTAVKMCDKHRTAQQQPMDAAATSAPNTSSGASSQQQQQQLPPLTSAETEQLHSIMHYVLQLPDSSTKLYNIPWHLADRFRLFGTEFAGNPKKEGQEI